jgi:hypothetical protein
MKDVIIEKIEEVRRINNSCWMQLLKIALDADPEHTKEVLALINKNDKIISNYMSVLANDADSRS